MTRRLPILVRVGLVAVVAALAFVSFEAVRTLSVLEQVEAERDTWQQPDRIIAELQLRAGDSVVDLGSGAGYFALRLGPVVGRRGRVIAVDIRRQSLAFLWMRSVLRRQWQVDVLHSSAADVRLPHGRIDAVLIANTYHELTERPAVLRAVREWLKPGGRLVIADRGPHTPGPGHPDHASHGMSPAIAASEIAEAGFATISRDDAFIDRPGDDTWWLIVCASPPG